MLLELYAPLQKLREKKSSFCCFENYRKRLCCTFIMFRNGELQMFYFNARTLPHFNYDIL